jgi:hypothetical protein
MGFQRCWSQALRVPQGYCGYYPPPFRRRFHDAARLRCRALRFAAVAISGACEMFAFPALRKRCPSRGTLLAAFGPGVRHATAAVSSAAILRPVIAAPGGCDTGAASSEPSFVVYGASLLALASVRSVAVATTVLMGRESARGRSICSSARPALQLAVPEDNALAGRGGEGIWWSYVGSRHR